MPFANYRSVRDLPPTIALFPLRGAILLPRFTLPLNIFEPRYLAMFEHVISTSRVLGIIQPLATAGEEESPADGAAPLKQIGCAGRVTAYQELDDGRLAISLTGVARFRTVSERSTGDPYRSFDVSYEGFAGDLQVGRGEDEVDRKRLLPVLKNYLEARDLQADWTAIENASTELLINVLSIISPFGPEEKQALLEAADLAQRAEILKTLATMELAADNRSGGGLQ